MFPMIVLLRVPIKPVARVPHPVRQAANDTAGPAVRMPGHRRLAGRTAESAWYASGRRWA